MLYNGVTGDKSVPSTRFRAFTANQHQVAAGLCRRLSPTALIGAVPSATAPATARHASGMENESKNHSAPPPAVGLIPLGTWSNTPNHRLYTLKNSEEAHRNTNLNSQATAVHRLSAVAAKIPTHAPTGTPFPGRRRFVRCQKVAGSTPGRAVAIPHGPFPVVAARVVMPRLRRCRGADAFVLDTAKCRNIEW